MRVQYGRPQAVGDEMLVPRGKEVSTLVAYRPRRRTEHQFVEQIAVAVPNPDRDNLAARRRPPGSGCVIRVDRHQRPRHRRPRVIDSQCPHRLDSRRFSMARRGKVIVSCAVTGSIHVPTVSEYLPITADEIADGAIGAAEAGAAIVHLHARDPRDGRPTPTRRSSPSSCPRSGRAAMPSSTSRPAAAKAWRWRTARPRRGCSSPSSAR